MKTTKMLILGLISFGAPALCQAALVEDGSAFTGNYVVQERSCEKQVFSYFSGDTLLVPDFAFQGTTDGLKVDGTLMAIQPSHLVDHGGGIQTDVYSEYKSGSEFETTFVQINPSLNQGQKTVTVDNYTVAQNGSFIEITQTTTTLIGDQQTAVSVCHFLGNP